MTGIRTTQLTTCYHQAQGQKEIILLMMTFQKSSPLCTYLNFVLNTSPNSLLTVVISDDEYDDQNGSYLDSDDRTNTSIRSVLDPRFFAKRQPAQIPKRRSKPLHPSLVSPPLSVTSDHTVGNESTIAEISMESKRSDSIDSPISMHPNVVMAPSTNFFEGMVSTPSNMSSNESQPDTLYSNGPFPPILESLSIAVECSTNDAVTGTAYTLPYPTSAMPTTVTAPIAPLPSPKLYPRQRNYTISSFRNTTPESKSLPLPPKTVHPRASLSSLITSGNSSHKSESSPISPSIMSRTLKKSSRRQTEAPADHEEVPPMPVVPNYMSRRSSISRIFNVGRSRKPKKDQQPLSLSQSRKNSDSLSRTYQPPPSISETSSVLISTKSNSSVHRFPQFHKPTSFHGATIASYPSSNTISGPPPIPSKQYPAPQLHEISSDMTEWNDPLLEFFPSPLNGSIDLLQQKVRNNSCSSSILSSPVSPITPVSVGNTNINPNNNNNKYSKPSALSTSKQLPLPPDQLDLHNETTLTQRINNLHLYDMRNPRKDQDIINSEDKFARTLKIRTTDIGELGTVERKRSEAGLHSSRAAYKHLNDNGTVDEYWTRSVRI